MKLDYPNERKFLQAQIYGRGRGKGYQTPSTCVCVCAHVYPRMCSSGRGCREKRRNQFQRSGHQLMAIRGCMSGWSRRRISARQDLRGRPRDTNQREYYEWPGPPLSPARFPPRSLFIDTNIRYRRKSGATKCEPIKVYMCHLARQVGR